MALWQRREYITPSLPPALQATGGVAAGTAHSTHSYTTHVITIIIIIIIIINFFIKILSNATLYKVM